MNNAIIPPLGSIENAKQNLAQDLAIVAADGGAMLSDVVRTSADEMALARKRLETSLCQAKSRLLEGGMVVSEKATHAAEITATYVRENPWKTLGIAAATGVIVGALLKRW